MRLVRPVVILSTIVFLAWSIAVGQRNQTAARTESAWGLQSTTFETSAGRIRVDFPDDMAAGDTISGRVYVEPKGESSEQQRRNQDELNGYVFRLGKDKIPARGGILKWLVPTGLGGGTAAFLLTDSRGKDLGNTKLPILKAVAAPGNQALSADNLPVLGQSGRPGQIVAPGVFDGNSETAGVTVGGREAQILAESPRKLVFQNPLDVVGSTKIECQKGAARAEGSYRNAAIRVDSRETNLPKGGQTELTVTVKGMQGLSNFLPLTLRDETPRIVTMQGGNQQVIPITEQDLQPDGSFTLTRLLTALQAGPFAITAFIGVGQNCGQCKAPPAGGIGGQIWCVACATCATPCSCNLWGLAKKQPGQEYGALTRLAGQNVKVPFDPTFAYQCFCE